MHLEFMISEIVLSMQFFSKQNNSSVFMLGLAGKKSVCSFFTPNYTALWVDTLGTQNAGNQYRNTDFVLKLRKTGFCEGSHKYSCVLTNVWEYPLEEFPLYQHT